MARQTPIGVSHCSLFLVRSIPGLILAFEFPPHGRACHRGWLSVLTQDQRPLAQTWVAHGLCSGSWDNATRVSHYRLPREASLSFRGVCGDLLRPDSASWTGVRGTDAPIQTIFKDEEARTTLIGVTVHQSLEGLCPLRRFFSHDYDHWFPGRRGMLDKDPIDPLGFYFDG